MFHSKRIEDGTEVSTLCTANQDPTFDTVVLYLIEMQAQTGKNLLSSDHLVACARLQQIVRPLVKTF